MPDVCPRSSRAVKVCEDGKTIMKIYLILGLLVTAAYSEKKINLDDIEKDNLRAESKFKTENIQTETKYSTKPVFYQPQYQITNRYNTIGSNLESFFPAQQLQNVKYSQLQSPEYVQPNKYSAYEYKQPNQIVEQQNPLTKYSQLQSPEYVQPNKYSAYDVQYKQPNQIVQQQNALTKYSLQSSEYIQPNKYSAYDVQYKQPNQIVQQQNALTKYSLQSPEYVQPNKYSAYDVQYKQPNQIVQQQNSPLLQYYNGYQQQEKLPAKNIAPSTFESQKLNYQPEISIGNNIQNVQQKTVTDKYTKIIHKEPAYINIPVPQSLPYYPHLGINALIGEKGASLPQPVIHQLSSEAAPQQISIPIYTPVYNQKQSINPAKQLDQYPLIASTASLTKVSKVAPYPLPIVSKKSHSSPVLMAPLHVQPQQQLLGQGKKLLYTQAYIRPTQPQYLQQLVYAPQPGVVYSEPNAAYSDFYARIPAYIQDNALRDQVNQYQIQHQQLYVVPTTAHEAPKQVLQEQINQNIPQSFVKSIQIPKTGFIPPQSPAQDFKSGVTQLEQFSFEDEESSPVKDYSLSSQPKSLLDTYIPSKIIAAQDATRYAERPIKLEGGFLPSNFLFKKSE